MHLHVVPPLLPLTIHFFNAVASMEKPYHHNRQCEVWMSYTDLSIFSPKIKWKVAFPESVVVVWHGGLCLHNGFCHLLVVCVGTKAPVGSVCLHGSETHRPQRVTRSMP